MSKNKLAVIDGETLMDMRLEPVRYCIEGLLPQGVAMISGAPKTGKGLYGQSIQHDYSE